MEKWGKNCGEMRKKWWKNEGKMVKKWWKNYGEMRNKWWKNEEENWCKIYDYVHMACKACQWLFLAQFKERTLKITYSTIRRIRHERKSFLHLGTGYILRTLIQFFNMTIINNHATNQVQPTSYFRYLWTVTL